MAMVDDFNLDDWLVTSMAPQIDHTATGLGLRILRENHCLSLRKLGARMDLSAAYLSGLELGKRNWSKQMVRRFVLAVWHLGEQ